MAGRRILRRSLLPGAIALATIGAFVMVALRTADGAVSAATSPNWLLLAGALAIGIAIQPLRALAWSQTLAEPVPFRAVYASSAIGSFLDTVLPARLGEASKVAVLRVAGGKSWPGVAPASGSLLAAHSLEAAAFCLVGATAAAFVPFPTWARGTLGGAVFLAAGLLGVVWVLRKLGRRLPRFADRFLAAAVLPRPVMLRVLAILLATWLVRWLGATLLLNAVGVDASLGVALVYLVITGLANTAPLLPGNAGVYQGAALGALAMVGHAGAHAVAASLMFPIAASVGAAAAAMLGIALYGRRFAELPRAAFARA
jgi:uncharacterized membrane protein YbhN (UPF0104 family)